ncbi:FMN-binding protein [Kitasatospora sp. NPDC097643]|uniref:FMN-binding protein n=1 Tax=Kitasatospora sp. NPDC097643 TaxID=3157230 RepID=UPI003325644B
MRRAIVSCTATTAGVILLLSLKPHQDAGPTAVVGSGGGAGSPGAAAPSSAATGSAGSTGSVGSAGATRKVAGTAVNTRYGPVQVQVTLSGSRITTVDVLRYPTGDRRDREINGSALPLLNQEAIAAQSAAIDVVSGATYTSEGYIRSLQSALDQAAR